MYSWWRFIHREFVVERVLGSGVKPEPVGTTCNHPAGTQGGCRQDAGTVWCSTCWRLLRHSAMLAWMLATFFTHT